MRITIKKLLMLVLPLAFLGCLKEPVHFSSQPYYVSSEIIVDGEVYQFEMTYSIQKENSDNLITLLEGPSISNKNLDFSSLNKEIEEIRKTPFVFSKAFVEDIQNNNFDENDPFIKYMRELDVLINKEIYTDINQNLKMAFIIYTMFSFSSGSGIQDVFKGKIGSYNNKIQITSELNESIRTVTTLEDDNTILQRDFLFKMEEVFFIDSEIMRIKMNLK